MNKIIASSIVALLLAFSAGACDAGKGTVTPVKVTTSNQTLVEVPFNYLDCAAPATVSFTVVTSKKSSVFTVRVRDIVTGVEYLLDPYAPISDTFSFPPLPAAGHSYVVALYNGSRGKITASIFVR